MSKVRNAMKVDATVMFNNGQYGVITHKSVYGWGIFDIATGRVIYVNDRGQVPMNTLKVVAVGRTRWVPDA